MANNQLVSGGYSQIYRDLKRTIHYHRNDTYWSCVFFLCMQYSIPVLSAFLTAFIGTKILPDNIVILNIIILPSDILVLIMAITLTMLGALNSILKPAESYEWAASFSNKFEEFEKRMRQCIFVSATPADYEKTHAGQVVEQVVRPTGLVDPEIEVRPATHQVDDVLQEIRIRVDKNERVLITTLTKRMAEQLTDYLTENGVKVRYLHSDVDTVERVEIIRDLRLGAFDVLVGINLLREGLDIPEVSLVAILDADKEGFLRAERSLIQTIGRAARNLNGRAILYADRITDSMKKAIGETERRRTKQIAFNEANGITPKGVVKRIKDLIDGVYSEKAGQEAERLASAAQARAEADAMSEKDLGREIKRLEKLMLEHARNLEFEQAARVRDQLGALNARVLGAPGVDQVA